MNPLIAGNWKMHLTRADARALTDEIVHGLPQPLEGVDVAIFPPFTALSEVVAAVADSDVTVGGQNVYPEDQGAFTGEIGSPMLLDAGATRVLCGHSERRHILGEDDSFTNRKLLAALGHDILPTLCVGETLEEREAGQMEAVVERQLRGGLAGVETPGELTVAYEPVWAIGTGRTPAEGDVRCARGGDSDPLRRQRQAGQRPRTALDAGNRRGSGRRRRAQGGQLLQDRPGSRGLIPSPPAVH
jgi:triosephosphate isomerase